MVFFTPPTDKKPYLILTLILMGVLAYFGKNLLFRLLNSSLGYVDSSLVEPPQGEQPYVRMPGAKLDAGVFISYRRSDTAAYTGRLYDYLTDHFHRDSIFVDLDDIAARLAKKGVQVNPDELFPGVRRFYAADPFGNRLEFLSRKST